MFVHRKELVEQTQEKLGYFGLKAGVVAGGYEPNYELPIQIISVASWSRRKEFLKEPDIIVIDEAHRVAARTWAAIAKHYKDKYQLLFTATPERLDGQGLASYCDEMILGPSVQTLVTMGSLSTYEAYSVPSKIDFKNLKTAGGDYTRQSVVKEIKRGQAYGDVIQHYGEHLDGKQALLFAPSVELSTEMAQKFSDVGYSAAHLDGETPRAEREATMALFRAKKLQIICNVDLFAEGLDVPGVAGVMLLRPTMSLTLYLQQIGRALRPDEGKEKAIILDFVGNVMRHGPPCMERHWNLAGRGERKKAEAANISGERGAPFRMCPHCFAAQRIYEKFCKYCGKAFNLLAMKLKELKGQLVSVDSEAWKAHSKEQKNSVNVQKWKCKTLEEMRELGAHLGYKSGWADIQWKLRMAKIRERQERATYEREEPYEGCPEAEFVTDPRGG